MLPSQAYRHLSCVMQGCLWVQRCQFQISLKILPLPSFRQRSFPVTIHRSFPVKTPVLPESLSLRKSARRWFPQYNNYFRHIRYYHNRCCIHRNHYHCNNPQTLHIHLYFLYYNPPQVRKRKKPTEE